MTIAIAYRIVLKSQTTHSAHSMVSHMQDSVNATVLLLHLPAEETKWRSWQHADAEILSDDSFA